jgi:pyruvate formate lyase activating enzyme
MKMTGILFDIKRFAVHDGPGIRTTVFLKGCPLKCLWCHNPESISPQSCTIKRVSRIGELTFRNEEVVGQLKTVEEVMEVLEKEWIFMDESGGGVTFSGGEPMLQPEFLAALLTACKNRGMHTAVDTCGFVSSEVLLKIAPLTDLFLYDLKMMDSEQHLFYTGVPNQIILENLQELVSGNCKIRIRIPVIPEINDTPKNISETILFLKSIIGQIEGVDLLPFHNTASGKYRRFELNYTLNETRKPVESSMNSIKKQFEEAGFEVKTGG